MLFHIPSTKAINFEDVATDAGLSGHKAAYKRLWDLKNKMKPKAKATDGETISSPDKPKAATKIRKPRSTEKVSKRQRKPAIGVVAPPGLLPESQEPSQAPKIED